MARIIKDLGIVTAYGLACSKGYSGTEEEFAEMLSSLPEKLSEAAAYASEAALAADAATGAAGTAQEKAADAERSADAAAASAGAFENRIAQVNQDNAETVPSSAVLYEAIQGGGGGGAVDSVNGQTGAVVLDAEDVGALPDSTTIPDETTVAGWGFTKNTGTYSKPSSGIPANDLAAAVQTSLGKADTALQTAPVTSVNGQTGAVTGLQTAAITDAGGYFTTDTVEAALQEIGAEIAGVNTLIGTGVIS